MTNENTAPTLRSLDMPRLIVELPDGKEIQHHLSSGEITIGRDPKNRIAIADDFISKFHAKLIISKTEPRPRRPRKRQQDLRQRSAHLRGARALRRQNPVRGGEMSTRSARKSREESSAGGGAQAAGTARRCAAAETARPLSRRARALQRSRRPRRLPAPRRRRSKPTP